MSFSFSNDEPPHFLQIVPAGSNSAADRSNQMSAPFDSIKPAMCSITLGSARTVRQLTHVNPGIGTPHTRCRDKHQSGLLAIIPLIRSLPQGGIHWTCSISASVFFRRSFVSIDTNHCSVARKMTGFLQRQQCG